MARTISSSYTTTQNLATITDNPTTVTGTGTIAVNSTAAFTGALVGNGGYAWTISNFGTLESLGSQGFGINLLDGGFIANGAAGVGGALIEGTGFGIQISGTGAASGTVTNYGTIAGISHSGNATGIVFNAVPGMVNNGGTIFAGATGGNATGIFFTSGGVVSNTGLIDAAYGANDAGVSGANGSVTVSNSGTIEGLGSNGFGISQRSGGVVTNGQRHSTSALIEGGNTGIYVTGSAGTVTNFGTIFSAVTAGTNGIAIYFKQGGLITNYGLIAGNRPPTVGGGAYAAAIIIHGPVNTGTVLNFGTIASTNLGNALNLDTGGTLVNGGTGLSSALITGSFEGVIIGATAGTVTPGGAGFVFNYGTIQSTGTSNGIQELAGGTITNRGLILGGNAVLFSNSAGAVYNFGTVISTATASGAGILLGAGGVVTNQATASITAIRNAILARGGVATVVNAGLIQNSGTNTAIYISNGGTVINNAGGTIASAVTPINFNNTSGTAVSIGSVLNFGTIQSTGSTSGSGVYFAQGGVLTNETNGLITALRNAVSTKGSATTLVNFGTIAHIGSGTTGEAIYLGGGGTVTNYGLLSGARPGTPASGGTGGYPGVVEIKNQVGTTINFGTITNPNNGNGVNIDGGGLLVNGSTSVTSALISVQHGAVYIGGTSGIPTPGAVGFVFNYGTIESVGTNGSAINLVSGGTVLNRGLVLSDARTGVSLTNTTGTIDNFGTILSYAPVSGTRGVGVYLGNGGVITNEAGGVIRALRGAVSLAGTTSAAATVSNAGIVTGSVGVTIGAADTGANTVVNTGTIVGTSGIAIGLGSGNDLVVIGTNSSLVGAIGNVHPGVSFDLPFLSFSGAGTVTLASGNNLKVVENSSTFTISLDPSQNLAADFFQLANDGSNGTEVQTVHSGIYAGTYTSGIVLSNPAAQNPVTVTSTGYGANNTAAYSGDAVYGTNATAWNFTNLGTIRATQATSDGVRLTAGGTIVNGSTGSAAGSISGYAKGVEVSGGPTFLVNYGTIANTRPGYDNAVFLTGGAETVVNAGTVIGGGTGINLYGTGNVTNRTTGLITAYRDHGAYFHSTASILTNAGTIAILGTATPGVGAVGFSAGGYVLNNSGGLIRGNEAGVYFSNVGGTVINSGAAATIAGATTGVRMAGTAGTIINSGLIAATGPGGIGVALSAGSTLTNAGTISGAGGTAVAIGGNSLVTVAPNAVFAGAVTAAGTADTLALAAGLSAGTIAGIGSRYTGFNNIVVNNAADWQLVGTNTIVAGDTVALGVAATLGVVGTVDASGTVAIGSTALLQLGNASSVGGTGEILFLANSGELEIDGSTMPSLGIAGFAAGDSIDLTGISANGISYNGSVLTLTQKTAIVAQLNVSTVYGAGAAFSEERDATGGTLVTVAAPIDPSYTLITNFTKTNDIQTGLIKEFPSGVVTGNQGLTVPFGVVTNSSGNNYSEIASTLTVNLSLAGVARIYTLINAYAPPAGALGATVEFIGTGGADQTFNLVNGTDMRDFFQGPFANSINGTTTKNMFTVTGVTDAGGSGDVNTGSTGTYNIDEQVFTLGAAFVGQTLQQIVIRNAQGGSETPILLGLTAQAPITGQVVSSGATLIVSSGEVVDGTTVLSGGTLIVLSGGLAGHTSNSGAEILSGGIEVGGVTAGGGVFTVSSGGVASAGLVSGAMTVSAGGSAVGEIVSGGQIVLFGSASNTTLETGGSLDVQAGGNASGTQVGGGETVEAGGTTIDTTIADGTLDLVAGSTAQGTITFAGSGGLLLIGAATMPTTPIAGVAAGDGIDLRALTWAPGASAALSGTTLTITGSGGVADQLTLTGVASRTVFVTSDDGSGGTLVEAAPLPSNIFSGTYANGLVLSDPAVQQPAVLTSSALVMIGGSSYNRAVYGENVIGWTVINFGTVLGQGVDSTGIGLAAGGSVVNGAPGMPGSPVTSALVTGTQNGVAIEGASGSVVNFGTIASTSQDTGVGVHLARGGRLVNGAPGSPGALVSASRVAAYLGGNNGVAYAGAAGTVINYGTMTGSLYDVVALVGGGTVANYGSIVGQGTASGGVYLSPGGFVLNEGVIIGPERGVYITGGLGTVINEGSIAATNDNAAAVGLAAGGSVLNDALITAYRVGVFGGTAGSPTSVINLGTIAVTATGTQGGPASFGVLLLESGVVGNIGVISAVQPGTGPNTGGVGVALVAGGVVTNGVVTNGVSGGVPGVIGPAVIRGASYGVLVNGGAAFVSNYGTIAGATGVSVAMAAGGSTIVNAGTISGSGGIAVKFGPGEDVLVEAAGSVLQGAIGNLQAGDVIDLRFLPFVAGGSAALGANNLLSVVAGGATAGVQLDPAQNFAGVAFALSDDGQGGTDVKETVFGIVGPGQTLVVSAGVTLTGVTVLSGGTLDVLSGGAVITTSVAGGGTEIVEFGGLDVSATLAGLEEVFGLASGTVLLGGASQVVEAGGVTQAVVLDAAAVQTVSGVASGTVVSAGDRQIVASGGVASGTVVSSGGQEIVQAGGTMLVPVISGGGISGGGLVDLQAGGVAGGAITFSGRGGELELDSNAMPAGPLVGFDRGDLIDLRGVSPAGGTVSFDPASGFLTVSGGGVVDTLVLQGGVTPGTVFRLGDDGQGGSLVEAGPPAPGGLGLQASSDSGALGDGITNVAAPLLLGSGEANDTVTVFDGTVPVGSATVEVNGSWASQLSTLAEGQHTLTARETDPAANVSGPSAGFSLRLDLTPPVAAVTAPLTVLWSSGAVPFGIGAPSDANDLTSSLSVLVTGVPGNGAVTLADGVTPVTPFESLSVAQLTGLEFIPGGSGKIGTTGTFGYTVFDPAGNTGAGSAAASVVAAGAASLFSFVFSYADGRDYYTGTVADNGAFGYQVGQTRATASGQYMIVNAQTLTTAPVGTVSVLNYTHGGAGQASGVPLMTAAGQPDGTAGLGSEADAVLGTDGQAHPFSATSEAMFGTIALYGFVYTYANGAAFYSGTVADDGTLTAGTKTVSDSSGRVLGTYTVFADGVTTRAGGSVVVDRYNVGDTSFLPIHATAASVDGSQGLGSELGSIPVNGTAVPFGAAQEPGLQANIVPVPVVPPPPQADIFTAEITEIYSEVLGRGPQGGELATGTSQLSQGVDLAVIRQGLAQSGEAQGDLNQLYQQILDRPGDTAGQANYTAQLIDGASLATVQLLIAQSPEAQADINQIYLDVLGTGVDGFGLTSSMGALANGSDINAVRSAVAHSPAADDSLSQLFLGTIGRIPDAAELAGMEDQLGAAGSGVSRTGLQSTLAASGSAGGFTMVTAGPGSAILTAPPNTPTEFVFGNIGFGADTITGFDPSRDALVISSALVPDLATLQSETRQTALGTLITLSPSQSITLPGINLDTLNPNDFRIV